MPKILATGIRVGYLLEWEKHLCKVLGTCLKHAIEGECTLDFLLFLNYESVK